jgi:hypothetical protein
MGQIAHDERFASLNVRKEIRLASEDFAVTPNHVHGVVQGVGMESAGAQGLRPLMTIHPLIRAGRAVISVPCFA